jgi:ureidoglycolate lyase
MMIKPQKLAIESFKKYGNIVLLPDKDPTSEDETYKFWSDIAHYHIEGRTEIGLCTVYQQDEVILKSLERHLNTPEILIPADASFVLPLLGEDHSSPEAFAVNPGEAVVIEKGIWHGPCIPIQVPTCTYFVIFKHNTPHEDVYFKDIDPIEIDVLR